jgi:hypothetical protein
MILKKKVRAIVTEKINKTDVNIIKLIVRFLMDTSGFRVKSGDRMIRDLVEKLKLMVTKKSYYVSCLGKILSI